MQEEDLRNLAANGSVPQAKIRERLSRIGRERERIQRARSEAAADLASWSAPRQAALDLLEQPGALFRSAGVEHRRLLDQALFEKPFVDRGEMSGAEFQVPLEDLVAAYRA